MSFLDLKNSSDGRSQSAPLLVATSLLALGGISFWIFFSGKMPLDAGLWFVALLVVVLMALTLTAVAFSGLKLSSKKEAFGLPSGSIRALLAIGIMTLLVVFGLKFAGSDANAPLRLAEKPFQTIDVAYENKAEALARYQAEHFMVIVTKEGAPAPKTGDKSQPATFELYEQIHAQSPAEIDVGKQLNTAIITLLTSIIGFYFGSRSVADSQKSSGNAGTSSVPDDIVSERKTLGDSFATADAAAAAAQSQLATIRARPALASADEEKARQTLQTAAQTSADQVMKARTVVQSGLADADKAITALRSGADGDVGQLHEAAARDALAKTKPSVDAFTKAVADFTQQISALVKAAAEG